MCRQWLTILILNKKLLYFVDINKLGSEALRNLPDIYFNSAPDFAQFLAQNFPLLTKCDHG